MKKFTAILAAVLVITLTALSQQTTKTGQVGSGTAAQRPSTCAAGDLWSATDSPYALSKCGPANTWNDVNQNLLNFQTSASASTGNSSDKVYYTYTLPANTLRAGECLRATALSQHTTGVASVTFHSKFGGTTLDGFGAVAGSAGAYTEYSVRICNVTTSSQIAMNTVSDGLTNLYYPGAGTSAINTTSSAVLDFTFNVANTDQITPKGFIVERINQ